MSEPEVGSRVSRLWKHSSVYALGAALGKVASFLLIPLVTSFIGTRANYGVKEIAEVSIVVAGQLLGLNLLHGTTRFWADYENEEDRWRLASTTLWLLALTTGVAALLGTVFSETLAGWLFGSAEFAAALRVTAWILFAQTVGQVGLRVLQVRERSGTYVAITLSKLVLEVGLKVVFLVVLGLTYMGVLYPVLLGEGLLALGTIAFLVKRARFAFSKAMARRLVRYSAPLVLSGLCMFCLHQVDRFFLRTESGLGEVGVYGLAYKLGSIGNALVFEAFALIWFPFVFALKDAAKEREWMRRVIPVISDLSVATALSLSLFGRELVTLVAAPEFHNAWQPMPLILAGYVFWAIYQVVSTPLYLAERTGLVAWIVAGAALVNLALNAILVPAHGAMGAAWATALTFCALAIAAWMASERVAKPAFPLRRTLLPLALGAGAFLLGTQFAPSSAAFSYSIRGAFVVAAWCWVGFQARSLKAGPSGSGSEPR